MTCCQPLSQCDTTKYRGSQQEDGDAVVEAVQDDGRKQIRCDEKCDHCKCGETENPHTGSIA